MLSRRAAPGKRSEGSRSSVALLFKLVAARAPVRQHRRDQGGPAGLVRGAEAFAGVAVEIFVERNAIAPCRVPLQAGIRAQRRSSPLCIAEKKSEQPAFEFFRDLREIRLLA